jgi:O-methyltransferase
MIEPFQSAYINLLKKTLTDFFNINSYEYYPLTIENESWKTSPLFLADKLLRKRNFALCKMKFVSEENRTNGYDWPAQADTMIGINRLNNIESCIYSIINDNVEGDFIETGVWRGGAAILMRAILKELNIADRKVWVADSFKGLPRPSRSYPADHGNKLYTKRILSVSLAEVKNNFTKYDLLDEQVAFLEGWFKDTLRQASIHKLSLLRLDGDLYESTWQSLNLLYPKLSAGGYIIVDDYNAFDACRSAITEYRNQHNIQTPIIKIDKQAIYWRKA